MKRLTALFFMSLWTIIALTGCDQLMGGDEAPLAPQPAPAMAPIPGQPAPAPVPGQPVPVQPVAPVPGQPAATPPATPIPGQPAPVPGQPVPAQPVAAPVPGQPAAPMTPPTPTGDALTDKLNTKKFQLANVFTATSGMVRAQLKKGKSQGYQVQLPGPPYCHSFIAVAEDKVANLDMNLQSPAGTVEAQDTTQESAATILNHCPAIPGLYKVEVAMPAHAGEFAIQAFSK